jgi:hypothetical protein
MRRVSTLRAGIRHADKLQSNPGLLSIKKLRDLPQDPDVISHPTGHRGGPKTCPEGSIRDASTTRLDSATRPRRASCVADRPRPARSGARLPNLKDGC